MLNQKIFVFLFHKILIPYGGYIRLCFKRKLVIPLKARVSAHT